MLKRILVVDDSEPDLLYTRIVLERAGVAESIVPFESAPEALQWLAAPDCPGADLILLDINMPGMNGFEFLEAYERQSRPERHPVVVMLTSSPDPGDQGRAAEFSSVQGYVTKPLAMSAAQTLAEFIRVTG